MLDRRARILPPYTRRIDDLSHKMLRVAAMAGLIMFAMLLGFVTAILPIQLLLVPMVPLIFLTLLMLWVAPDFDLPVDNLVCKLFMAYTIVGLIIPYYIAPTLPGIGWVSFNRMIYFPLFMIALFAIGTSARVRGIIGDALEASGPMKWFFIGFVIIQGLLIFMNAAFLSRWINAQLFWYFYFILSIWVFSQEGASKSFVKLLLIGAAVNGLYGIPEFINEKPFWTDHIPAFLRVEEELLAVVLGAERRTGEDFYRVGASFFVSLSFAEFIAIVLPFALHFLVSAENVKKRAIAAALIALLAVSAYLTGARSGLIGTLVGAALFILIWSIRRYRTHAAQRDMVAPAVLWMYPAGAFGMLFAVLFINRVRMRVLGGSQHSSSTDARYEQWEMALPHVMSNPIGHGPFVGPEVVGYAIPSGMLTLDSYGVNLIVEYGPLGLLLFTLFFFWAVWLGLKTYFNTEDGAATEEEELAGPAAVATVAFLLIRLVLSQTEVLHFSYAIAAMIVALHWRQTVRIAAARALIPAAQPFPPRGALPGYRPAGSLAYKP